MSKCSAVAGRSPDTQSGDLDRLTDSPWSPRIDLFPLVSGDTLSSVDTILVREEETHERCDCHVCNTLRNLFAASVEAEHDRRSPTPLLLTFGQAAELLGVGESTVRELVGEQELRAVTVQSDGRRRIP